MPLDTAIATETLTQPAMDAAANILKHAVKIWAREQGVAERELTDLTRTILEFADAAIQEAQARAELDA